MKDTVHVLGICNRTKVGQLEWNIAHQAELIEQAVADNDKAGGDSGGPFDLIVMSESSTTGFCDPDAYPAPEIVGEGPSFQTFMKLSKRTGAIIGWGFNEAADPNHLVAVVDGQPNQYNSFALVDGDTIIGVTRKCHLSPSIPRTFGDEPAAFIPGSELGIYDTRLGRLGTMICMDGMVPEVPRTHMCNGADLLVWPVRSWGGQAEKGAPRVRAEENCVPMVHVDGWHEDAPGWCHMCDHHGRIQAENKSPNEVMSATLDLREARRARKEGYGPAALFRVRRPELYGPLLEPTPTLSE